MQQAQFNFYVVRSNPSYPEVPRIFFVKKINSKISWAIELDEIQDTLLNSAFDLEEAELWGTLEELETDGTAKVKLEDETFDHPSFSQKMAWSLQTLMTENHGIARYGHQVFPMLEIHRDKYKDNAKVIAAEIRQFKNAAAEKSYSERDNIDFSDEPKMRNLNKKKSR